MSIHIPHPAYPPIDAVPVRSLSTADLLPGDPTRGGGALVRPAWTAHLTGTARELAFFGFETGWVVNTLGSPKLLNTVEQLHWIGRN